MQWFRNRTVLPRPSRYADSIEAYDAQVAEKRAAPRESAPKADHFTWSGRWPEDKTLLFGVGAMKAGTSWLFDYLSSHPDVHFSPQKEVHYFDVLESPLERHHLKSKMKSLSDRVAELHGLQIEDLPSGIRRVESALSGLQIYKNLASTHEEYREFLLKAYRNQKVVGDITPSYCALPEERLAEMYQLAPSVKFVFVMRDPIDRLWSAVRMHARQQNGDFEGLCRTVAEDILRNRTHPMLTRSGYGDTIRKLRAVAPEKDILFLFYETMFRQEIRDMTCDFLDISHHHGSNTKVVNAGLPADIPEDIRDGFYALLEPEYEAVRQAFGTLVPPEWSPPAPTN